MDILFCTPSFHHPANFLSSIFFEDQVRTALLDNNNRVRVISVNLISFKNRGSWKYFIPEFISADSNNAKIFIVNFIALPKLKRLNFKIQLTLMKFLFLKYIKSNNLPQIIHAQQFDGGALALWAKKRFSVQYVLTEHTSIFARNIAKKWEITLARKVYSESCYNIAVSREFADFLSELFNVKFHYLPNVVNTELFTPGTKPVEKYTFVNVAGLDENKNHKLLIESFSKVFKGNVGFELLIIGDGPAFSELKYQIEDLKISEQVKLLGKLNRSEIKMILGCSSCFVLSSRYETFGIVIIEAMSCGLPVVSTKSKGPESIIINDWLGILCESNLSSLSDALLLVTQKKYNSEYIRSYAVENFSETTIGESLGKIYKKVLSC
jgi:glycosyltransferase involved in cell wall biosynthesis